MSTLKADGIIASTGTNTNLTLEGKGTGGVKITDYLVETKGADIASATALTLGKDGNFFDVTGTTTITSIGTQGIGSHVTLHFDGILIFTHHATDLILPGAANITTAVGDIAVMYEYASGDWRCVSYTKASGAAVVAGGGLVLQSIEMGIAAANGTTLIPGDDTVPVYDEGTEIGSQAITLASTSSRVLFQLAHPFSIGTAAAAGVEKRVYIAAFRSSDNACIGMTGWMNDMQGGTSINTNQLCLNIIDAPATSGSVTYSVRIGLDEASGTTYWFTGSVTGPGGTNTHTFGGAPLDGVTLTELSS